MSDKMSGALLTPSMREFYRENPEETGSKARSVRQRTRDRFCAGIQDIIILSPRLRDDDRRTIIDNFDNSLLSEAVSNFITIFAQEMDIQYFESIFETGIRDALNKKGYQAAEVNVTIDVEREPLSLDEILDKMENGEGLNNSEINFLLSISSSQITDQQAERLQDVQIFSSKKDDQDPTNDTSSLGLPIIIGGPTRENSNEE